MCAIAGFFLTKVFHPNISKSGEICVNVLKRDWKPDLGLRHVLVVIRCLLIQPFPDSALNEEAGKLLYEDYEAYAKHARLMTSIHAQAPKRYVPSIQTQSIEGMAVCLKACQQLVPAVTQSSPLNWGAHLFLLIARHMLHLLASSFLVVPWRKACIRDTPSGACSCKIECVTVYRLLKPYL